MKLLRYEYPKTYIHTYGMSDNPFFKDKNLRYVFTVKENATMQDLKDKEHDIKHLNLTYDRVVL